MNYWSKGNPRQTSMEDCFLEQNTFQLNNIYADDHASNRFSRLSFDLADNINSNYQQNIVNLIRIILNPDVLSRILKVNIKTQVHTLLNYLP